MYDKMLGKGEVLPVVSRAAFRSERGPEEGLLLTSTKFQ